MDFVSEGPWLVEPFGHETDGGKRCSGSCATSRPRSWSGADHPHNGQETLKNPENLTDNQQATLAQIADSPDMRRLHRGWQLKEALRTLLKQPFAIAITQLKQWLAWASRSRLPSFVKIARTIRRLLPQVHATLLYRLSNARSEAINTKIELIKRRAYGFHSAEALIALAHLTLSGLCPPLPGRHPN